MSELHKLFGNNCVPLCPKCVTDEDATILEYCLKKVRDNRDDLYLNLRESGVSEDVIGTQKEFKDFLKDESNTRDMYKSLRESGVGEDVIGSEDDFYNFVKLDFEKTYIKITGKSGKTYTIDKDEFEKNMDDIINGNPDAEIDVENDESYGSVALRDYKDAMAEGWNVVLYKNAN